MKKFKLNQKVIFSEAGKDYFSSFYPSLKHILSQDEGEIVKIDGEEIHVKWDKLGDTFKALDWAIEPKLLN